MRSYFTRLLAAFILTSLVPLCIAGVGFYLAGRSLVYRNARIRADETLERTAGNMKEIIDKYRHVAYVISKDETILQALEENEIWDSQKLQELYKHLYAPLEGSIYSAAAHVIRYDGANFFSTHTLPRRYDLGIYENYEGIFSEKRPDPEKSYLYVDPFISERGDRVSLSILREIDSGYIIVDVYATAIVGSDTNTFFDSLLLVDDRLYRVFDFYHPERDGTYDNFPELQILRNSLDAEIYTVRGSFLAASRRISDTSLYVVGGVHLEGYMHNLTTLGLIGIWFLGGLLILSSLAAYYLSRSISGPVYSVVAAMKSTENGQLCKAEELGRNDELGYLVHTYNSMVEQLDELIKKVREEEKELRIAEKNSLQAQINPHFLYNTLGTMKSMAKLEKNRELSDMVSKLGKLIHLMFRDQENFYSLEEEVNLIIDYIDIQKYRFGERLKFEYRVEPSLYNCSFPRLLLQPLVENAVLHGVENSSRPVLIEIVIRTVDQAIEIEISDSGEGMAEGKNPEAAEGIGIRNVRKRIELIYGKEGSFEIQNRKTGGVCVIIRIPKREHRDGDQNDV